MDILISIVNIITGIITLASVIVKMTDGDEDDIALGRVKKYLMPILEIFSINGTQSKKK